ncbi:MAG: NAD(P)-dependent oxidoreductase [Burkholderiaceae bacterium]
MIDESDMARIGFIGLGVMGYPMAGHLLRAGHHVTVFNRTPAKSHQWLAEFSALGEASTAPSPAEAADGAEAVFACVGDDADSRSVALAAFTAMQPGAVYIDHSTTSAALAHELAQVATAHGLHFLDAPVSGGQAGALDGRLTVMCGGDLQTFERVRTHMTAYAQAVTRMGPTGSGQLTKMVNQICIAGLLQGLAEGLAFGERAGLDMAQVLDVIGQGAAQSWQLQQRGPTMLRNEFDSGFAVDWMRKDLGLVLDEARRNGARLPVTALVDQFYADLQGQGGQRWDTSALIKRLR